jgi:hypothetical protein
VIATYGKEKLNVKLHFRNHYLPYEMAICGKLVTSDMVSNASEIHLQVPVVLVEMALRGFDILKTRWLMGWKMNNTKVPFLKHFV